ncbi:MAG: hypothetical protein ACRDY4_15780 [Acidimicrobiia bacterium]
MAGSRLAGVVGAAACVSVASLVLAQLISHHGVVSVLFVVFLLGTFTLLAGAVFTSEQWVQGVWATRESWSQGPRKRLGRRVLLAVRAGLARIGRTTRAGVARIRLALTGEGRRRAFEALRRVSRDALDSLGLPLEQPPVVSEHAHAPSSRRAVLRHRRGEERRRTFMPAEYRTTRDALEKATAAAKARNAALRGHCAPFEEADAAPAAEHTPSGQRAASHHPNVDTNTLRRAFTTRRSRAAREALKKAGHTALVSAMGILPDRSGSVSTR